MRQEEIFSRGNAKRLRRELTKAEAIVWKRLKEGRAQGLRFRRQHPIGPFIADFASDQAKLVVEIDGDTHGTDDERAYDARREAFLQSRGWRVVRFWNVDVYSNLDGVIDAVYRLAVERG